jgi:hypothetical protein
MIRKKVRVAVAVSALLALGVLAYVLGLRFHLWTSTDLSKHDPLAVFVSEADNVLLWEGLPHQDNEPPLYKEERASKASIRLGGFYFYDQPLEVTAEDAKQLTALFCNKDSFHAYKGEKTCGGYHPDWCVEWRNGREVCRAQVCLGCSEMKAFGPWTALHCDITRNALDQFRQLLGRYTKNRPPQWKE